VLRKKPDMNKRGKALCFDKSKISESFCFENMNLGMFNRLCPSLKAREQLKERVDLNKFDRNEERYVIPMHRKNFWSNKWMQEPRKNFCRLQVQHCDPSAQYRRIWRTYKRKRGLTLCYKCRIPRHLSKEFPGTSSIFCCCKIVGHEVEDCPRMIAKVKQMNMRQENYEGSQENKSMLENNQENESEKAQTYYVITIERNNE
jgi:hypothetical protein